MMQSAQQGWPHQSGWGNLNKLFFVITGGIQGFGRTWLLCCALLLFLFHPEKAKMHPHRCCAAVQRPMKLSSLLQIILLIMTFVWMWSFEHENMDLVARRRSFQCKHSTSVSFPLFWPAKSTNTSIYTTMCDHTNTSALECVRILYLWSPESKAINSVLPKPNYEWHLVSFYTFHYVCV